MSLTLDELLEYAPDAEIYRRAGTPSWLDELDLRPGPPFARMGTHALDPTSWLIADAARDMELELRGRLIDDRGAEVFAAHPGTEQASEEVLALVTDWSRGRGLGDPPAAAHPLEAAARHVQEDLCLMVHRDGDWHLDAGALCFPTFWSLQDKLGRPTSAVHGPVAHYAGSLSTRVDRFFDRLRPATPVWRRNLSVKPYPLLFLPTSRTVQPIGELEVADDGAPMWLRSERQTLRRLPDSDAILFTIRVQLAPASTLLGRPDRARDLAAMYRSWDQAMLDYKIGANDIVPAFVPWLERVGRLA
ncbi:MAG: DUF3445 domain-containing protein [Acidimicrobiia bacterium]